MLYIKGVELQNNAKMKTKKSRNSGKFLNRLVMVVRCNWTV